jgi:hypothetical protein
MPPSLPLGAGARFPTRQYPYRARSPGAVFSEEPEPLQGIAAGAVVRFFLGADEAPVEVPQGVILQNVNDPFATLVLARGHRPLTLLDTLAIVNTATGADAVPGQHLSGGRRRPDPLER